MTIFKFNKLAVSSLLLLGSLTAIASPTIKSESCVIDTLQVHFTDRLLKFNDIAGTRYPSKKDIKEEIKNHLVQKGYTLDLRNEDIKKSSHLHFSVVVDQPIIGVGLSHTHIHILS